MGSTISKAKQQLQFKTLGYQSKTIPCSTKTEISSSTPAAALVPSSNRSIPRTRKSKHRRHHPVGKVSVKRSKPKYKKVTKSIIGKPTNFKHTGHMGAGDLLESSVDTMALSNELNGIASQINCFDSQGPIKKVEQHNNKIKAPIEISSAPPPPLPPHLYISTSAKKRASKNVASSGIPPVVPVSFRRRQYRKAVSRHHPNLGLVNALMIEIPTFRSISAA